MMLMVQVGVMWVIVRHFLVTMPMHMRLACGVAGQVLVLVMLIVDMKVLMLHFLMGVLVSVLFHYVQQDAQTHQRARNYKCPIKSALADSQCKRRACEWRCREIGAGARGSQMTEREHKEHKTDSIPEKTNHCDPEEDRDRWQFRSAGQCEPRVCGSGSQPFPHCDFPWIAAGNPARQIVVDPPAHTRCRHQQGAA